MSPMPDLQTALLDLLHALANAGIRLIVGGGFGICLKTALVRRTGEPTLLRESPEVRSTNDLDLFLRPELLVDSARLAPLAKALAQLGYRPVPGAMNYQFAKPGPEGGRVGSIKLDLLTGPQSAFRAARVKVDDRRVRPRPAVGVHAHPVDEAVTLAEGLTVAAICGRLSSGIAWQGEILLPHPYTYLMMKLFAFRDRLGDRNKDYGRYHALDLYTILATTTESEWQRGLDLRDQYRMAPAVIEARRLVATYFAVPDQLGLLRLRESPYCRPELQLDEFRSALCELFPTDRNQALETR